MAGVVGAASLIVAGQAVLTAGAAVASTRSPRVLLVGSFNGRSGRYHTIQSAVDAARPGDTILVGPGDYHEIADEAGAPLHPAHGQMGGVYIGKSGITLRGMDRSSVIVDGTNPGAAPCSNAPSAQNYGAMGPGGVPVGRNGILIWKADDVRVENLTVCNFLAGTGASGNQVWWNGGDGSGRIGLQRYSGGYLTATSTFFKTESTAAQYGIFASNSAGPATLHDLYGANMNDSGTYVGACQQACDVTMNRLWMEYSALGYSGTNSGGAVVVENSVFDHNRDGFDTNTQVIGDPPAPQDGTCPDGGISPITHTTSCWVVTNNFFLDNNNPNTPALGGAAGSPVGTGMTVSGGRNDTVMNNTFSGNGAWGILFVPYAQAGKPSLGQTCKGEGGHQLAGFGCVLDPESDALINNTFSDNGYFANPSNSDFGQVTLFGGEPQNCYQGNVAPDGYVPSNLELVQAQCGPLSSAANRGGALFGQVLCDSGLAACPPGTSYPAPTGVRLHPLPLGLQTMPDPCAGVPANAWCPASRSTSKA